MCVFVDVKVTGKVNTSSTATPTVWSILSMFSVYVCMIHMCVCVYKDSHLMKMSTELAVAGEMKW